MKKKLSDSIEDLRRLYNDNLLIREEIATGSIKDALELIDSYIETLNEVRENLMK